MIRTRNIKDGVNVMINGDIFQLMEDLTSIIRSLRENFRECYGDEVADAIITHCGKMSYAEEHEEKVSIAQELEEVLRKVVGE